MAARKVLVCDDNAADLSNLERIASGAGCMVIKATNGKEAIEKAKTEKPDLIFMDIVMPDLDGYAATRALQSDAATKSIPVVFVTSKNQKADQVWAQMQGGKELVGKPFSDADILAHIKAA